MSESEWDYQTEFKAPSGHASLFEVIVFRDSVTPMAFITLVLKKFFAMDDERASHVLWTVQSQGSAACGVYTRDVSESKVQQVTDFARAHHYPLLCDRRMVSA